MNQNNKFIGYLQHGTKQQPNRTDNSNRIGAADSHHGDSTVIQDSPSWVYKGEWNGTHRPEHVRGVPRRPVRLQLRPRQQHQDTRYESLITNVIPGGGRDWLNKRRRNQYTGALSYFKDNFAGRLAQPQVRRRVPRRVGQHHLEPGLRRQRHPFRQRSRARTARGDDAGRGSSRQQADRTRWRRPASSSPTPGRIDRLTLNVGARFDRYRVWLPEQSLRRAASTGRATASPGSRRWSSSTTSCRGSARPTISPAMARRCSRPNWGRFYFNPGVNLADAVNPNTANQYSDYDWNDLNDDRVYQDGEETTLHRRVGGIANASIDADLKNSYTDEASVFVEREVIPDLGVRAGFVWKKDSDGWQQLNVAAAVQRLQRAGDDRRSGPDGNAAPPRTTARSPRSIWTTPPAASTTDHNVPRLRRNLQDARVRREQALQQSLVVDRVVLVHLDARVRQQLLQQPLRDAPPATSRSSAVSRSTPTNTPSTSTRTGTSKFSGTVDAGWGLRVTPVWKVQSGAPYGRFFSSPALITTNPSQAILVEPIGTRRQDTVSCLDFRVEKQLPFATGRGGPVPRLFNTFNSNTAVNINWGSGASFEKARPCSDRGS